MRSFSARVLQLLYICIATSTDSLAAFHVCTNATYSHLENEVIPKSSIRYSMCFALNVISDTLSVFNTWCAVFDIELPRNNPISHPCVSR